MQMSDRASGRTHLHARPWSHATLWPSAPCICAECLRKDMRGCVCWWAVTGDGSEFKTTTEEDR